MNTFERIEQKLKRSRLSPKDKAHARVLIAEARNLLIRADIAATDNRSPKLNPYAVRPQAS